ncbi:MAG: hypothetical protein ACI9ZT_001221 [Gammaproteobacteria bacterium]|jgi:hypothetical protein
MNFLKNKFFLIFVLIVLPAQIVTALDIPDQKQLNQLLKSAQSKGSPVAIQASPLNQRSLPADKPFTKQEAVEIGIPRVNVLTPDEFIPPYWNGRGIASGDVNKDGYVDIAIATKVGMQLYLNDKGKSFKRVNLKLPTIDKLDVFIVALVDINNDSWLDIFLTSYRTGNYTLLNDKGKFSEKTLSKVPASPLVLTKSLTFGDVDRDGDVDAVLGNWFYGYLKHFPPADSDNKLMINNKGVFTAKLIPGIAGESLSILLSDFTADQKLDLMVGNDFAPPDYYYRGDGKNTFKPILASDGIIPVSTNTTMSMDTGDFNNDLNLDIYAAQIAAGATGPSANVGIQTWDKYCAEMKEGSGREDCEKSVRQRFLFSFGAKHEASHIKRCEKIPDVKERKDCASMMILLTATRENKKELCDKIPEQNDHTKFTCRNYFKPKKPATEAEFKAAIPVTLNENTLLKSDGEGHFVDIAKAAGVETTGWSWNAKFADLDNDEWQDIYVVNGTWIRDPGTPSKFFFHNQQGKSFIEKADEFGLQNYMLQSAFTETDIDNDGDLDILANSTSGPLWFYRNNDQNNNAIEFEFNDNAGNYFGLSNKIIIHYGKNALRHQIREIKSGGGFLSFNAPIVHFGLGKYDRVSKIEVHWSTGEKTKVTGNFVANARYKFIRNKE